MLKFTSLVSVLAMPDLLFAAQQIYSRTYETIPLLVVATLWYLVLTTILTWFEHLIERRLKRGHNLTNPAGKGGWRMFPRTARVSTEGGLA
jgi:polar amino acid transport system permease protein